VSGNWGTASTWQCSDDGASWQTPTSNTPTSANSTITIRSGNNVSVAANVTVDQATIDSGGTVTVNATRTWTIANGAGTDLTVNGTVVNAGTITPTGTIAFNSGSIYQHSQNGGTIPVATWNAGSEVQVTGVTATAPAGLNQSFANFTWNSPQTARVDLNGALTTIHGNLKVLLTTSGTPSCTTGYRSLAFAAPASGTTTITIDGDFIGSGNTSINLNRGTGGTVVVNVGGNFNFTGGYFMSQDGAGNATVSTLNFTGAGKTFFEAATGGTGGTGGGWLDFTCGIAEKSNVGFHVNNGASLTMSSDFPLLTTSTFSADSGGTLNTGTYTVTGNSFTLASGGSLGIGSAAGITSSGATGNIQTTTRNYNTGANYTYNGSAAQVTGNGLPATVNNLTINNASGVTLTNSTTVTGALGITGALTVSSGVTLAKTGTGTITLNGNLINNGAVSIDGNGGGCQDADPHITITSATSGTWSGAGGFQLFNVSIDHQTADPALGGNIVVFGGTDNGNNTNFTINTSCSGAPTAVALKFFTATDYGGKVLLQWRTGEEVNNLGFHLYREENGKFTRLTPEPVAGSALLAGRNITLRSGRSYSWWDDSFQGVQSRPVKYWVEDIDLRGKRNSYGPVTPVSSQGSIPPAEQAALLSRLAKVDLSQAPRPKAKPSRADIEPLQLMNAGAAKKAQKVQWALAGATAVKLFVKEDGWYRVTQPELTAYGLDRADPRRFELYVEGQEVPIVVTGRKDGHFDSGDAVEFYGTGLDTSSTDTRAYWLIVGSKRGKRVSKAVGGGGGKHATPPSFLFTIESKPRVIYFSALNNGEGNNKFFGPLVSTNAADPTILTLNIRHPDPYPPGKEQIQVVLQGVTDGRHTVNVTLNDQPLGQVTFSSQGQGTLNVELALGLLKEGENQVKLVATGGDMDISLVDIVRLSYYHTFTADDNALRFTADAGVKPMIGGFDSAMIRVMDITDPLNVREVLGRVEDQGSSNQISITVPGPGTRTLLAFAEGGIKEVSGITANIPSSWNSRTNGADMVIISHSDFLGSLGPLKQFRESQGYSVALIDVEDLYDEFSFGNKTPQAMRDFLWRAFSTWQKAPKFVLLMGNGSADPRNYLGYGDFDLVPTRLIQTKYNETASDDWFVDFNGEGLPEMAIGRIPVLTSTEAAAVVSKIVGYEQSGASGWTKEVLLVADIADTFDFEAASAEAATLLPDSITVKKIYRSSFANDELASEALLDSIDQGALLVNYLGHGSEASWRGDLITTDDVSTLTNGLSLPFFINMTCWNGWFADPYTETLGESLLKASNGGAVAVWASSGLTEPVGQSVIDQQLIQLLFGGQRLTLGEAVAKAKAAVSDMDIRRTWILLGDPATRLK
jgi:hypothetical protein